MEHLFHAFRRVQEGLDDPIVVLELFQRHENLNDPSTKELVRRGAEFPTALSENEMKLLMARYWLDGMDCHIDDAFMNALDILEDIKEDYLTEVCDRLDHFREPLYDEDECKAVEITEAQSIRRRRRMSRSCSRTWPGCLQRESLGFSNFGKRMALRHGDTLFSRVHNLLLVLNTIFSRENKKGNGKITASHWFGSWVYRHYKMERQPWPSQMSSTCQFLEVVDKLRHEFKNRQNGGSLSDGLLPTFFLYLDHESATSLFVAHGHVDVMWIWAVDPDYECETDPTDGYQGYVRVGFKQLVDNFYFARRWQSSLSMKDLWSAAQRESNKAFVSVESETPDKLPLRIESNNVAPESLRLFHPIRND